MAMATLPVEQKDHARREQMRHINGESFASSLVLSVLQNQNEYKILYYAAPVEMRQALYFTTGYARVAALGIP